MKPINIVGGSTTTETRIRADFLNTPIPDNELLNNLGLYLNRQTLSRILFIHELYHKIINVHGVIIEFGVRWGQNLSLFESYRGIYEPYNYNRKIIGFDTFSGFPELHSKDGEKIKAGDYSVTANYDQYLEGILDYHESESPLSHIKKYQIVKGDATQTIVDYIDTNPETIVSLILILTFIFPQKNALRL